MDHFMFLFSDNNNIIIIYFIRNIIKVLKLISLKNHHIKNSVYTINFLINNLYHKILKARKIYKFKTIFLCRNKFNLFIFKKFLYTFNKLYLFNLFTFEFLYISQGNYKVSKKYTFDNL